LNLTSAVLAQTDVNANYKMTRQFIKTLSLFFFLTLPFLTVGQTQTVDTSSFEKSYLELQKQIDSIGLHDSLLRLQDIIVSNFFKNPATFNYSFKVLGNYSFLTAEQLRMLTVDARNDGSFPQRKTFIQYKGTTGKINLRVIDGEATGKTEDNLLYSDIYKLKSNLFLIVGSGIGSNSCFFYGARVFQIQGDHLLDYSAFGDKSFFSIESNSYENIIFKFNMATQTLIYDCTGQQQRTKGQFHFNGNKFIKK
jgi:hypothetical protein